MVNKHYYGKNKKISNGKIIKSRRKKFNKNNQLKKLLKLLGLFIRPI